MWCVKKSLKTVKMTTTTAPVPESTSWEETSWWQRQCPIGPKPDCWLEAKLEVKSSVWWWYHHSFWALHKINKTVPVQKWEIPPISYFGEYLVKSFFVIVIETLHLSLSLSATIQTSLGFNLFTFFINFLFWSVWFIKIFSLSFTITNFP